MGEPRLADLPGGWGVGRRTCAYFALIGFNAIANPPPFRQQFVDGAPRQVKSYRRSWLIDTLKRFRNQLAGG